MTAFAHFTQLPAVDRSALIGTWHVQQSTFPMWLTGRKLRPSLTYGALPGDARLTDTVRYFTRSGGSSEIRGHDTQDPGLSAHFTWRGRGLLALLKSEWLVYYLDAAAGVAGIYFTKTLFTPEGMDLITRAESPAAGSLEGVLAASLAAPALAGLCSKLQPVSR